jgi:hypothetical protein
MNTMRLGFSISLLLMAACVGGVDVGGPRTDSGSPDGPGVDAGVPQNPQAEAAADAGSPITEAYSYANGNVACAADTDCCVVFDGCLNEGLVVSAADESQVANLLSEFDQAAETNPGGEAKCNGCIPPPVQVSCVKGKCLGTTVEFESPDGGGVVNPAFLKNHCGSIPNAPVTSQTGSILGC